RPVDYRRRREALADLQSRIGQERDDRTALADELLADVADGRIKAYLIYQTLRFRRAHEGLFTQADYLPLEAVGARPRPVCACARPTADRALSVIGPRLMVRLVGRVEQPPLGHPVWGKTRLLLPSSLAGRSYCNLFTGEVLAADTREGGPSLGTVLG